MTIGDVTFDWEPQTPAGVDVIPTGRGSDARLEQTDRIGAAERKQAAVNAARTRTRRERTPRGDGLARSIVVKIGTTALTDPSGMFDTGRLAALTDAIEARMKAGSDVVIVSSGAITRASSRWV